MNLSCVICAELFKPSDDVHITPCGHMFHNICLLQWFERSKTCPQCRNKCILRSVHKVYFNLANLDTSRIDIGTLQQQVDDEVFKTKSIEKELTTANECIENLKTTQKKCMKTISALENRLEHSKILLDVKDAQINLLNSNNKIIEEQRKEILNLKKKIQQMSIIESIMSSTSAEVENILKENYTKESLGVWVVTLKRELRASETKKAELRQRLQLLQNEKIKQNKIITQLNEKILHSDSDIFNLQTKLGEKQTAIQLPNVETLKQLPSSSGKQEKFTSNNLISPTSNRVKSIEDSNSPYLNIQSSSIGLSPLLRLNDNRRKNISKFTSLKRNTTTTTDQLTNHNFGTLKKTNSDLTEKYSIFKKPRLLTPTKSENPNYIFNGFGGSEKARLRNPLYE